MGARVCQMLLVAIYVAAFARSRIVAKRILAPAARYETAAERILAPVACLETAAGCIQTKAARFWIMIECLVVLIAKYAAPNLILRHKWLTVCKDSAFLWAAINF